MSTSNSPIHPVSIMSASPKLQPRDPSPIDTHLSNIQDHDEKRRVALAEIDNAPFGWFHVRTCLVAGIGFFTDAYDLFAINIVSSMLAYTYYRNNGNEVPK